MSEPRLPADPVARLRLAAAGRRAYRDNWTKGSNGWEELEREAEAYDRAAALLEDDRCLLLTLPSWLVWDENGKVRRPKVTVEWETDE